SANPEFLRPVGWHAHGDLALVGEEGEVFRPLAPDGTGSDLLDRGGPVVGVDDDIAFGELQQLTFRKRDIILLMSTPFGRILFPERSVRVEQQAEGVRSGGRAPADR